ncbi:ubiquinol oxidase subunit II [Paenibacillus sp. FSL H7-0331]|uniref:ubiquinol oxidase subunit II n=2 Tax=Paenibacillus sp. FSL H7-0331 TaxID=1920421 RepID=UPI0009FADFD4|nr:ubiquinol oxidase subunit II [Paenibacillus sp. FSL H7-0331]
MKSLRPNLRILMPLLFILSIVLLTGCSEQFIVLDPKGPVGAAQKDLIWISTLLCSVVIVPVLLLSGFILWRYREKAGSKATYAPDWAHSTKLEVIWWGIPIIIIIILGLVTAKYTYALEPSKPLVSDKKPITVQVTSMDWKWLFQYPEQGIATVNYLQIPQGVPVKFELTSATAMNSFWIPQLGGQIYTMSGMAMTLFLQADEPGQYFGSGANFNGRDFAQMTFKVDATSQEAFDAWVKKTKTASPALTMDGYTKLAEPGPANVQYFSSFPTGLFERIVTQYAVGGSAHHHGSSPQPKAIDTSTTQGKTAPAAATTPNGHSGH